MSEINVANLNDDLWISHLKDYIAQSSYDLTFDVRSNGITYRHLQKRVFKLLNTKQPTIELNIQPNVYIPGYEAIEKDIAQKKHMGRMVGRYKGDLSGAITLISSIFDKLSVQEPDTNQNLVSDHPFVNNSAPLNQAVKGSFQNDFKTLLEKQGLLPLANWQNLQITHGPILNEQDFNTRLTLINKLGNTSGLYVYTLSDGKILYVGKAKRLKDRMKSHLIESYKPVKGDTNYQTWHRFFSSYPETLTLYWFEVREEMDRQILEKMLQQQLLPIFDSFAIELKRKFKANELIISNI